MEILSDNGSFLADGVEKALVGVTCGANPVAIYDAMSCIEILIEEGMHEMEAIEHFEYNVVGSHMGDKTPLFVAFTDG